MNRAAKEAHSKEVTVKLTSEWQQGVSHQGEMFSRKTTNQMQKLEALYVQKQL